MDNKSDIFGLFRRHLGTIALFGIFFGALSFLFLVISQKNFRVTADFLIIQNQTGNQDFYTVAKSSEYIGKILSKAVYSDLFVDEVINSGFVDKEFLPFNKKDRMNDWSKRVKVGGNLSVGMISVVAFDNDRQQATSIADAIAFVLSTKNNLFRGNDQNIEVRVISGPTVEKNPGTLNLILVIFGGFLMGVLIALAWICYRPQKEMGNERMISPDEYEESLKYLG